MHSYSRQQTSYLSNSCREDVGQWFNGSLSFYYSAVCIDATFIALAGTNKSLKRLVVTCVQRIPIVCK
ncbi:hypothetical protein RDV52_03610 [Prevotella nigrescens]|uniref:transposase n=1 Tax=Prevotella nigrescens TaxID=28133 RepID=UPI002795D8C6|nr:hypothetical protein [Prevotella nigrescens]WMS22263.1 hypothetical protein RDV52_03610 [Prevotella nigrescens]